MKLQSHKYNSYNQILSMTLASSNPCKTLVMKLTCSRHIRSKTWVAQILKTYFLAVRDNIPHLSNPLQPKVQESTHVFNPKDRTKRTKNKSKLKTTKFHQNQQLA